MLTGENGILTQAGNAKIRNQVAEIQERIDLWKTEHKMAKYTGQDVKDLPEFLEELVILGVLTQEQADEVLASENKELVIGDKTLSFLIEGSEEVVTGGAQPVIEALTYTRSGNTVTLNTTAHELEPVEGQYIEKLTRATGATYGFVTGTRGLEPENVGIDDSIANSYIEVDLTTKEGTYVAKIRVTASSEEYYDIGYIKVTDNSTAITDWSDNKLETSGEATNATNIELEGGQKYYIHFGYLKDYSGESGEDKFIINGIDFYKKVTNSALTYKYMINGVEQESNLITIDSTKLKGQAEVRVDNIVQTPKVPAGFRHLKGTKDEGYVITDIDNYKVEVKVTNSIGNSTTATTEILGNEFVWVPVDDFSEFQRETFGEKWWTGNFVTNELTPSCMYEPVADGLTVDTTASTLMQEVQKMYKSVKDNGGFYIGRYETGNEGGTLTITKEGYEEKGTWDDKGQVVIKKNTQVYNYIGWADSDSMSNETGGAVEKAREFAASNGYTNVTSTLCYGVQWDAVLRWISQDESLEEYLIDSSDKGNYYGYDDVAALIKTGSNDNFEIKNIYDMAGNVWEWTMESYYTYARVSRGGVYKYDGYSYPITHRDNGHPSSSVDYIGFRIALYLI